MKTGSIPHSKNRIIAAMFIALAAGMAVALHLGRYPVSINETLNAIFGAGSDTTVNNVIFNVRLPRILGAVLTGCALSVAGASYQGIFKNPMVSPSLLGVSSGAGFGAALGIILHIGSAAIPAMAFVFGLGAVALVYAASRIMAVKMDRILSLVLTGIVISSLFTSLLSLMKYIGDPYDDLPAITFWMMGSLADIKLNDIFVISGPVILGIAVIWAVKWRINIMTFSEEEAMSMGIETGRLRGTIIIASTVITASVVSVSGVISWAGLVIPHIARMIVGPDYRNSLPASVALGGLFMLMIDTVARTAFPAQIPLGILTALIGTPFFIYLMIKGKKSW